MSVTMRLFLSALLLVGLASAQQGAQPAQPAEQQAAAQAGDDDKSSNSKHSITGCLTKGEAPGEFIITNEKTGEKTVVTGNADLEKHSANHKVTVSGTHSADGGRAMLKVTSLKHVSETCQAPPQK